jgi:WD40 repeat protein
MRLPYLLGSAALSLALATGVTPASATPDYTLKTLIAVPASADNSVGGAFHTFDISSFDQGTSLDYVADRSNASIDIFSALTDTFVGRIGGSGMVFSGQQGSNATSGPDGVLAIDIAGQHQVWAGNGDSTLKAFNLPSGTQLYNIATGPASDDRVDEMAFDPVTKTIMAANNAASPFPFATLVNTTNGNVIKKITFDGTGGTPAATGGLEQSVYDPVTGNFFVSVPQIGGSGPGGVAEVNPTTGAIIHIYDFATMSGGSVTECSPSGLAVGTGGELLAGCSGSTGSIILKPTANGGNGALVVIPQVTGSDQVTFDPANNLFFLAADTDPTGPVLGIINGLTDAWVENIPTTTGDHSVAVGPNGQVFVPYASGNSVCPNGCVAVFAPVPEPGALPLMLSGLVALIGFAVLRQRRV